MTSKIISASVLAIAALASASSFAQDSRNFPEQSSAVSTKTRADVRAELVQAERNGYTARVDNSSYPEATIATEGGKTRAQVKAEVQASAGDRTAVYR